MGTAKQGIYRTCTSVSIRIGGLLCCLAFAVACSTQPASASSVHEFRASFGGAASTPANPYPLSGPTGVGVNPGGDIYVADSQNFRVEEFDSSGHFILAFGKEVNKTTKGSLCTLASGNTCQAGTQGIEGGGEFSKPVYVAVDGSSGASKGDVYVGDSTTNAVYKFGSAGNFISSEEGLFGPLDGIAVDSTGNLWVYDKNGNMFEFDATGAQLQTWNSGFGTGEGLDGLAVDATDSPYVVRGFPVVEKLTEAGGDVGTAVEDSTFPTGLAANTNTNDLYVDTGTTVQRIGTGASCKPAVSVCSVAETFGEADLSSGAGLAVDLVKNEVYVADSAADTVEAFPAVVEATTSAPEAIATTSATLVGTVNPDGAEIEGCHFEYGPTVGYGNIAPCAETVGSGSSVVAVHAEVSGLAGGTPVHYRLVASNEHGTARGEDAEFETLPIPVIKDLAITHQTSSSVDLNATINPRGLATTFHFELGTDSSYGTVFPDGQIPAGSADVPLTQHVSGLVPNVTYHWRVVATDTDGETRSQDFSFVYDATGFTLPDHRAYEMVTPPSKNGALIGDEVIGLAPSISRDGSRIIIDSIQGFGGTESSTGSRVNEGEPYSFSRTATGWTTTPMAPPATSFEANSIWNVSADTNSALFSIPSPPGGQDDFIAREPSGAFSDIGPASPPADGPVGAIPFGASSIVATADFSHIVYLVGSSRFPFDETLGDSVYEYIGRGNEQPILVGVSGGAGSHDLISKCGTARGGAGTFATSFYNSLSADGDTLYFTALGPCPSGSGANATRRVLANELYARLNERETVPISAKSSTECVTTACQTSPTRDAEFEGASSDGKRVFFTSTQELTDNASQDPDSNDTASSETGRCNETVGANGCNLYEYDFSEPAGHRLTAVSAGDTSGGGPRVQGAVAISDDGSHIYFIAKGILSSEPNGEGQRALGGVDNLYVYERDAQHPTGRLRFITVLPETDREVLWEHGVGYANVTPDGDVMVFASHGALTADDSRSDESQQIYRYDAESNALTRISIGEHGFSDNGNAGVGNARIVEASLFDKGTGAVRADPTMSDDGSYIFFQSPIALTPQALNDVTVNSGGDLAQNIYEYHDGSVYLISDGKDVTAGAEFVGGDASGRSSVRLMGTDGSGANVFFTTADALDPSRDTDTQIDYYDARECTAESACLAPAAQPPVPCGDESSCHGASPAPLPQVVAPTVDFTGKGNLEPTGAKKPTPKPQTRAQKLTHALKQCRAKRQKKKRKSCEKAAQKKFSAKKKLAGKRSSAAAPAKRRKH